jgi:hypothetical protein
MILAPRTLSSLKTGGKYFLLLTTCYLLLTSCKSDKPNPRPDNPAITLPNSVSNILITNEGGYGRGNATLSYVNGKTGEVTSDVFKSVNGRDLGDVLQSAIVWNDKLYAVVNNSQKIEVMDASNFRSIGTISGFVSPRYMLPVSYSKAYVSDIYANTISVVDLNSLSIIKTIPCGGWTERMIYHLGKVYVTNYWQPYLYVIDPLTDAKSDSIFIGKGAQSLVADKNDRVIVACGGEKTSRADTRLVFVNPYQKRIEKTIPFGDGYPSALAINKTKDSLYFIKTDVYKISIESTEIGSAFVSGQSKVLYGLGVDIRTNQIFVSDVIDYAQIGKVYVYSSSGIELAKFDAGINPGNFCFY